MKLFLIVFILFSTTPIFYNAESLAVGYLFTLSLFLIYILFLHFILFKKKLINDEGYYCEEHTVVTDDGYILTVQRIPFDRFKYSSGSNEGRINQNY